MIHWHQCDQRLPLLYRIWPVPVKLYKNWWKKNYSQKCSRVSEPVTILQEGSDVDSQVDCFFLVSGTVCQWLSFMEYIPYIIRYQWSRFKRNCASHVKWVYMSQSQTDRKKFTANCCFIFKRGKPSCLSRCKRKCKKIYPRTLLVRWKEPFNIFWNYFLALTFRSREMLFNHLIRWRQTVLKWWT